MGQPWRISTLYDDSPLSDSNESQLPPGYQDRKMGSHKSSYPEHLVKEPELKENRAKNPQDLVIGNAYVS